MPYADITFISAALSSPIWCFTRPFICEMISLFGTSAANGKWHVLLSVFDKPLVLFHVYQDIKRTTYVSPNAKCCGCQFQCRHLQNMKLFDNDKHIDIIYWSGSILKCCHREVRLSRFFYITFCNVIIICKLSTYKVYKSTYSKILIHIVHWYSVVTSSSCKTKDLNQDSFLPESLCLLLFSWMSYIGIQADIVKYMNGKILSFFKFSDTFVNYYSCSHFYSIFTQRWWVQWEIRPLGPVEFAK